MNTKQKFNRIDQSKLDSKQIEILKTISQKTNDFKTQDKELLEKIDLALDKIISALEEKNPNSIKPIAKRVPASSSARKSSTAKSKSSSTKTKSVLGVAKKSTNNIMSVAKEIQKSGESWKDAMERAKVILKERKEQVVEKKQTELQKLYALVKTRKELEGFANSDIDRDSRRTALPRGQRISANGNKYYENRENRTDRLAPNYPKDLPLLANGGNVDDSWELKNIDSDEEGSYGKVVHNGKEVADYEFDRYARTFWVENPKGGQMSIDTPEELFAFYKAKGFANGGSVSNERMYNFLQEDLQKLEEAIKSGDMEEVNKFFTYWLGSSSHLKSLETKTNERMYNFLKEDLEKLEVAVENNDTEEVERFFSYWGQHLESLKMANGGSFAPNVSDGTAFMNNAYFAKGGEFALYKIQERSKYDIQPKWNDEKFQTGGRKFLTFAQAQDFKKKLQGMSSSIEYKVVKVGEDEKLADGGSLPYMTDPNFGDFQNTGAFADGGSIGSGKNGYVAFYKGKQIDVYADTKYEAQKIASQHFKARKEYDVNVVLAELDGKPYVNDTMFAQGGKVIGTERKATSSSKVQSYTNKEIDDKLAFFTANNKEFNNFQNKSNQEIVSFQNLEKERIRLLKKGIFDTEEIDSKMKETRDKANLYFDNSMDLLKKYQNELTQSKKFELGGSMAQLTEQEFLKKYFGASVFTENPSQYFEIKKLSSSDDDKVNAFVKELKADGFTVKKRAYSDFTSVMGVKKKGSFELGGAFVTTDLAGHTGGGTGGLDAGMPLSGTSGTYYTGLVGETGAMSSGELFENGGGIEKKVYSIEKNGQPYDFALYTYQNAKLKAEKYMKEEPNYFFQPRLYNDMRSELPANERMYMPKLDKNGNLYDIDNKPFSKGDLADYEAGGAMMQNQQVIDDASQSYINYYLGEGASQGIYKDGGAIKNQYEGRTPEDIWNNLTVEQRKHFISDHSGVIKYVKRNYKGIKDYHLITDEIKHQNNDWKNLDSDIKLIFKEHIQEGQYASGGSVNKYFDDMTEAEILEKTIVFDNNGESYDRYTVFTPDESVFGMSEDAIGFNQYIGDKNEIPMGKHLGKKLNAVPQGLKMAVLNRMKEDYANGGSFSPNVSNGTQFMDGVYAKGGGIQKLRDEMQDLEEEIKYVMSDNSFSKSEKDKYISELKNDIAHKKERIRTYYQNNEEYENGGFTPDVSNGTQFMEGVYAEGGALKFKVGQGEKYFDKKEKMQLTIGKESDIPNVYNVTWEDGEYSMYSADNINFLISKGVWKKLDKMADGGSLGEELMGGQSNATLKPSGYHLISAKGREIIVSDDGGNSKERWVKNNGFSGYRLVYKGNDYEFTDSFEGGGMFDPNVSDGTQFMDGVYANGGKIKVGGDDFTFLLDLSDNELQKRLDLVNKQKNINAKQYFDAKDKKENTSKIEEAGTRLDNQWYAIVEARNRKNKNYANGGSFAPNVSSGTQFMYGVYADGGSTDSISVNKSSILSATKKCTDGDSDRSTCQSGNFEVTMVYDYGSLDLDFVYLDFNNPRFNPSKEHYASYSFTKGSKGVLTYFDPTVYTKQGRRADASTIVLKTIEVLKTLGYPVDSIVDRDGEKIEDIKYANGGSFAPNVSNGTQFMDGVYAEGGSINGTLNKKIKALADKKGLTMDALGRDEYNKVMTQALVESLTDANFHEEAKQVVVKAEGKTKWSDDLYRAESFNPDAEVASFAREVARICEWDGDDILNGFYFVTKMQGSKVGNMIDDLFLNPKPTKSTTTKTDWWHTVVNSNEDFNNFDDKMPIDWEVDDFKSWIVSESDLDGNVDKAVLDVVKMPQSKLLVEYLNKNGSGKNNDEYYKEFGNWQSALYDIFTQMKKDYLASTSSSKPTKYIDHADIKSVRVKYKGKEVTFKGEDVLNGANLMEKGGDLSDKAFYIPKRDVIEVELKDGTTIKPANGYWVKKGSQPISAPSGTPKTKTPARGKVTSPNYPNVNFNHKVVIDGKTVNLALSKSYVTGLDGSKQYDFIDVDGNPLTGYGFSVKEALKQIEQFANDPNSYSQTTTTAKKTDETKAHFTADPFGNVFVDSNFVNQAQGNLPNTELKHYGFGDFYLQTPDGNIDFIRTSEEKEGFVGRTHKMKGSDELVLKLVNAMKEKGRFEASQMFKRGGRVSRDWTGRKSTEKWGKNDLYEMYANSIDLDADLADYFKDYEKDFGKEEADREKKELIQTLMSGKIQYSERESLTFANGGAMGSSFDPVKVKVVLAVGLDRAIEFYDAEYPIRPYQLLEKAVRKGFITLDEINERVVESAMETGQDSEDMEEVGSSDETYAMQEFLDESGFKVGFVNGRLTREYADGGAVQDGDRVIITTSSLGKDYIGMSGTITSRKLLNDKYSVRLSNGLEMAFSKDEFKHNSINPRYAQGGGFMNDVYAKSGGVSGKLGSGVYRVGKPIKVSSNLYEQKIAEIFDNGEIATASDYGRKLSDFKSQKYPIITKEQLEAQYKMADGGFMNDVYAKGGEIADIQKMKKMLIAKAKSRGIYENFGQKEVRVLEDKYGYTNNVKDFDNWAMNFDLSKMADGGMFDDNDGFMKADNNRNFRYPAREMNIDTIDEPIDLTDNVSYAYNEVTVMPLNDEIDLTESGMMRVGKPYITPNRTPAKMMAVNQRMTLLNLPKPNSESHRNND